MDPLKLNLDPEFWPKLDPDPECRPNLNPDSMF